MGVREFGSRSVGVWGRRSESGIGVGYRGYRGLGSALVVGSFEVGELGSGSGVGGLSRGSGLGVGGLGLGVESLVLGLGSGVSGRKFGLGVWGRRTEMGPGVWRRGWAWDVWGRGRVSGVGTLGVGCRGRGSRLAVGDMSPLNLCVSVRD